MMKISWHHGYHVYSGITLRLLDFISANLLNQMDLSYPAVFWIVLDLALDCIFKVPHQICFPNLTILYLQDVCMLHDNSTINTLTFTFTVLERFELTSCRWLKLLLVKIYTPSLDNFFLDDRNKGEEDECIIKIVGAKHTEWRLWSFSWIYPFHWIGSSLCMATEFLQHN